MNNTRFSTQDLQAANMLVQVISLMYTRGECPATSGNFSFRSITDPQTIYISESGVDKGGFSLDNLIRIDMQGNIHVDDQRPGRKASDETHLHLLVYGQSTAGCVLHGHSLRSLFFAENFPADHKVTLHGLEILKAFEGIKTHQADITVPLYQNDQDIELLARRVGEDYPGLQGIYGFVLRGHGLTTWGSDVKSAKRHLEAFNYIFEYYHSRK